MKHLLSLVLVCSLSLGARAQTVSLAITQQPCNNNGIVTATFSGLSMPVTVMYYIGMQPPVTHVVNSSTDVLNNYSGHPMWVYAVDANQISASNSISAPPFTINVSTTAAACPVPGSATATITGGTAPYTYQWQNLSTMAVVGNTATVSLPAGGYKVTVTDAAGCVYSEDSISVFNNSNFQASLQTTPASCTNGSISVNNITGGTPPYSYLWTNGATTASINGLVKGNYGVTVTDANGCATNSYVYLPQNPVLSVNVTPTPATCIQTNGALMAFGSGGTPPYTYVWSNNVTGQSQSNVPAGTYSVDVTDANGCSGTGWANVVSNTPITVTQTATASSCTAATGSASLTISGGAAPYTVNWNTFPAQSGTTASNLAPGTYSFQITDANGCVRNGSVNVPPVNVISASISHTSPTCVAANGALTVTANGGATPYTYSWSNGGTTASISNLAAGNYSVVVTDAAGCSVTKTKHLQSSTPISLGFNTTQASCIYANDGSTTVTASGGTAPYTYAWSNGNTTATASNLTAGSYWVTVTDANSCVKSNMVTVPYNASGNSCYCTITGTVYHDVNNNCVKDPGEPGIPNIQIHCSGYGYVYTNANGVYSFKVPTGNYTITQTILASYPLASCQNNGISQSVTASSGCTQTVDFANSMNPIHDMHISTWDYNLPIPGYNYNMIAIISNQGTVTEGSIVGGLETDNQLPAPSMTPSTVFTNGGGNWYQITSGSLSMVPGATQSVHMTYAVPTNIPLSTSLLFKDSVAYQGPISNWVNDNSPWNNVNAFSSLTVGSFDPNFKEVSPRGTGANGMITAKDSVLEYMVHFQNLGTWYAQKVVVRDTLDTDLDWTSMRPIYQSHRCVTTIDENGVATFTFDNINLPPEIMNEPLSHGLLTYTIKTKKNLPLGTQFTNSAAIYFDFNEPVITNTTLNTLGAPQGIPGVDKGENGSFSIYPNPAAKMFYASLNNATASTAQLRITDISGKTMMSQSLQLQPGTQTIPVHVSSLPAGMYFVTIAADHQVHTQKLVIME